MRSKKMRTGCCILLGVLLLTLSACSDDSKDTGKGETLQAVDENDYASYLPYQASDATQKHASLSTNQNDTLTIGTGLMALSKEHFSPNTYTFKESTYLDYDTLDATTSTGLLGRLNKDTNPNGQNPEIGTVYPTEEGSDYTITAGDVLLLDIHEYDWYDGDELKGISLGFVINDKLGDEVNPVTMREDKLELYASETARKVVSYLRKKVPEVGSNIPIFVALYNTDSEDDTLPGSYFKKAFFETKTTGNFEDVNEQWVLFPTASATTLDGTTATSFDRFKANFKDIMPQDVSIIGKGHYMDGALDELRISVTLHARSAGEVKTAIQLLNDKISSFDTGYLITIDVVSDTSHAAVIKREEGSSKTTVITLI